jgi:class 3 adenylate cyclase
MSETRKLTTTVVTDVVAFSRLTAAEEELTLARLRALRSDLIDPLIAVCAAVRVPQPESLMASRRRRGRQGSPDQCFTWRSATA